MVKKFLGTTCAAVAFSAIAFTTAHAGEGVSIKVSDLNLSDPAAMQKFEARVQTAQRAMCGEVRGLNRIENCETGVRTEAMEKLAKLQGAGDLAKADSKYEVARR